MGYPSRAELVTASSSDDLTSLTPEQQDALRLGAINSIESYCRQTFEAEGTEAEPITKLVDGSGIETVYLPKRLAALTGLTIDGAVQSIVDGAVILPESGAHLQLGSIAGSSWLTRVRRRPGDPGPVFERGRGNVAVTGVWGWTDEEWAAGLLEPIKTAIRLDMEDQASADANKLASTIRSMETLGIQQLGQGNLSLGRGNAASVSVRVRRAIPSRLRWRGALGATA